MAGSMVLQSFHTTGVVLDHDEHIRTSLDHLAKMRHLVLTRLRRDWCADFSRAGAFVISKITASVASPTNASQKPVQPAFCNRFGKQFKRSHSIPADSGNAGRYFRLGAPNCRSTPRPDRQEC